MPYFIFRICHTLYFILRILPHITSYFLFRMMQYWMTFL